jgi:hypothetical protein
VAAFVFSAPSKDTARKNCGNGAKSIFLPIHFDYTVMLGPKSSRPQFVLLKFQSASADAHSKLADFITPNQESLVELLERNP